MYSLEKSDLTNIRKAKGVSRTVVKKDLTHALYKSSLLDCKEMVHTQVNIRSVGHQIGLYEQNKVSLSPLYTKRYIMPYGITTLAYGHRDIT